jgi:hypothetical protein
MCKAQIIRIMRGVAFILLTAIYSLQETFGLGTSTREEDQSRIDFHSLRIFDAWYFQIIPDLYAGAGIRFARQSKIRPGTNSEAGWESSPFVVYSEENGFNLEDQTSAGPSLDLIYDNRDNQNDPSRGVFADASYRNGFLCQWGDCQQFTLGRAAFRFCCSGWRVRISIPSA